jgi:hypothetical protein
MIAADLIPFHEPIARFVEIEERGHVRVLLYERSLGRIEQARARTLSAARTDELRRAADDRMLLAAMRPGGYGGDRPTQGDRFQLWLGHGMRTAFGYVDDAPLVLREFVSRVSVIAADTETAEPAPGYVRCEPIPGERWQRIRERGTGTLADLDGLGPPTRQGLGCAAQAPGDFVAVTRDESRVLRSRFAAHQFFVEQDGRVSGCQYFDSSASG